MTTSDHANLKPEDRVWYIRNREEYRVVIVDNGLAWLRPVNNPENTGLRAKVPLDKKVYYNGAFSKVGDVFRSVYDPENWAIIVAIEENFCWLRNKDSSYTTEDFPLKHARWTPEEGLTL